MARKSLPEALNEALAQEMERDQSVILMGEDNAGGAGRARRGGRLGRRARRDQGARTTSSPAGCSTRPISESAFIGAAIGAATAGLRPVAELMFVDFMGVCFDQIYNQAAKFRYMFGGKAVTPVVIRTMYGAGLRAAAQHSQCLYPLFTHIPGLKVVLPATPYDAKGLMIQAIRDNDPVIFFEHKALYDTSGPVPEESYALPFGEANVVREGGDVTIVTLGRMVHTSLDAAAAACRRRRAVRGHRPADDQPAGRGHRAGERRGHRPAGRGGRGASPVLDRHRHLRARRAEGVRRRCAPDRDGDRAAHPGAVLRRARGPLYPGRAAGGERHQDGDRVDPMTDDRIVPVTMPKWGLSMQLGKITAWVIGEGDDVKVGDDLADIETEKIAGTLEAADAGTVRRIIARVGEDVPVSGTIALIAPPDVTEDELDAAVLQARAVIDAGVPEDAAGEAVLETARSRRQEDQLRRGGPGRRRGPARPRVRRRPELLAVPAGADGRAVPGVRARPARARHVGQGRRRRP